MRNLFIVILLIGLTGCLPQRTFSFEGLRPTKIYDDRGEFQEYLLGVVRKVCIAHLDADEKIAIAATQQGQWLRDQELYLGDQAYVRSTYVLKGAYKAEGEMEFAHLAHAGSSTCSLSISQTMHIPQYFREKLGDQVEQEFSLLMADQGVEITYEFLGVSSYHVRQFSTPVGDNGVLDYYEFMTLDAFMRALNASYAQGGILQNNIEMLRQENKPS